MSKARSGKAKSGGGITMSKNVRPKIKAGPPRTEVISPSGVAAIGASINYPRQPLVKGTAPQVPSGNQVAAETVCGPGGSRTVYKSGYQDLHGKASPGEGGIRGAADRGERAILGEPPKGKTVA
jgi:hypothetical protein